MRAFNKRKKPKHAIKIWHNKDYIFSVNYFGLVFTTKRYSRTAIGFNYTYKFGSKMAKPHTKHYSILPKLSFESCNMGW